MATDLKLNGGIEAGGAITAGGNIVGNVVTAVGNVQGVGGVFSGDVSGTSGTFSAGVGNSYFKITPEGGFAVRLKNKSCAPSIKGTIVNVESTTDNGFTLTPIGANYNLGVVYESGVEDGAECWVVTKGIAEVLMKNAAVRGQLCRIPLTGDTGEVAGYAMAAAQAASTSVYTIGDVLESKDADVLCKVLLH